MSDDDIHPEFRRLFGANIANALYRGGGLRSVEEVRDASDAALLGIGNIGKTSLRHIRDVLGQGAPVPPAPPFRAALVLSEERLAALEAVGVTDFPDLSRLCDALGLRATITIEPNPEVQP